ncbi:MAG: MFS transporter [Treponema sp.]|jgi:FHS family glucose/mannose:H+ symporter-like MFS transporter|nr:MFS transporter [Treponema sp.]
MKNKHPQLLPLTVYGLVFFLGIEAGGFQLVLLNVASDFAAGAAVMGLLVSVQFSAITIAPLCFGWLSDRVGKKRVLLFFMPVFTGGCFLAACSNSPGFFISGVFLLGIGYSVCECVGTSALSDSFPGSEKKYLNIMQCAFSLGAVISPQLFSRLIFTGVFTWRLVFLVSGCGYVLLYPFMLTAECRRPVLPGGSPKKPAVMRLFGSRFFIALLVSMLAYVAMETGAAYFADSLFVWEYDNAKLGAYAISSYWLAMAVSRFLFAWIKMRPRIQILLGFASSGLLFIMLLLFKNQWVQLGIFAALGAMMGSVWPMIVGIGTSTYREMSGTVASILMAAGGFGGALIPVLIGSMAEHAELYHGFGLLAVIAMTGYGFMKFLGKP